MSNEIQVLKYTFKRTQKRYDWSEDVYKGYTPYLNNFELPYFIDSSPELGDWSVWEADGEGRHVCGGLTYAEAKESFKTYYTAKMENFYKQQFEVK